MSTEQQVPDIKILALNEAYIKVLCKNEGIERELSELYSFKIPNAQFDPRVKAKKWDGYIRLYSTYKKTIYKGLLTSVLKYAVKQKYTVDLDPSLRLDMRFNREELEQLVVDFIKPHDKGKPITPYDYQYDAVNHMLGSHRSIILAATSAGKSMMLYLAARMYQMSDDMEGRQIFIIVPSKSLVEQLYDDFDNYSNFQESPWKASQFVQKVSGDYEKMIVKPIVITTWQSLKSFDSSVIANAGAVFVDEAHTIKGPVLQSLLESATNCKYRHGLTGTLDGMECNEMAAQGLLGPVKKIVSAKQLIEDGKATKVNVRCVVLNYDENTRWSYLTAMSEKLKSKKVVKGSELYQAEIEFINNLQCRFNFIQRFVKSLKGNTIVLFDRVETYGVPLYEHMKAQHENTFLIIGDVEAEEREDIRKSLETTTDAIVYATSRIMSTGVNIKNLHNIVTVASNQSQVQTLQTIGRLMRLHDSKDTATIYDLVDDLTCMKKRNYMLKHVEARLAYYNKEGHPVKFVEVGLNEAQPDSQTVK